MQVPVKLCDMFFIEHILNVSYHEKCFEENWWVNTAETWAWLQNIEMMNIYGFWSMHFTSFKWQ